MKEQMQTRYSFLLKDFEISMSNSIKSKTNRISYSSELFLTSKKLEYFLLMITSKNELNIKYTRIGIENKGKRKGNYE